MAYNTIMIFIETTIFTKAIIKQLTDDSYKLLQKSLIINPENGTLIPGSNGLRKLRWGLEDKGKSGGIRVIYFWDKENSRVYMLLSYSKNEMDNLSQKELVKISKLVRENLL